jgi:hypothetical protein
LAQHAANTRRRVPEEDLALLNSFNLLTINSSPQQSKYVARPELWQTGTVPAPWSAYPQSPPFTPSPPAAWSSPPTAWLSPPTAWSSPPVAWSSPPTAWSSPPTAWPYHPTAWSSPPAAPRFGVVSPIRSPLAAISPQYRSTLTCTNCQQTGHSSPSCPETQCYRCKYTRTEDGSVMLLCYCTALTARERELILYAF